MQHNPRQEERRAVFEESSAHIRIGLDYLPAVARRLHHCRDLVEDPPFDFLTWFEFTPADGVAFDELRHRLRETRSGVSSSAKWNCGFARCRSSVPRGGPARRPRCPGTVLISVNDEVVHGVPGPRQIKRGAADGLRS